MAEDKVLVIRETMGRDLLAEEVSNLYQKWKDARREREQEWNEVRRYVFATDTSKTGVGRNNWSNKTTIPKLCQIRDNLHANYYSSEFSTERFSKWEAYGEDGADKAKRDAIEAYMENKIRQSKFRAEMSKCMLDYIDYGIAITDVVYENNTYLQEDGETKTGYVGPRAIRISPTDIVFNPLARSFKESPNIVRILKDLGELEHEASTRADVSYNLEAIKEAKERRNNLTQYSSDDLHKALGFRIDGFGDLTEYYNSGLVELLVFEGTLYHQGTGKLEENRKIVVLDRSLVIYNEPINSSDGKTTKNIVTWRNRPDNLYGMGPLDNILGMQYRIDHLENCKADMFDFALTPPVKIKGTVNEFEWKPGEVIFLGEDGEVTKETVDTSVLAANYEIEYYENKMEEMAGAPKQAMGVRTPGEKTAYEVQVLENAAGRIFQAKSVQFSIELLEPTLNTMLDVARRNMDSADVLMVIDDEFGVESFLTVTPEDIKAKGKIMALGARHFSERAQMVQNLTGFFNSAIGADETVRVHFSGKAIAKMVEDLFDLGRYGLVRDNIRVEEMAETQQFLGQVQEEVAVQQESQDFIEP